VFDDGKIPWVTKKLAGGISCSGWKMAGEIFLTVIRGDGSQLSDQRGVGTAGRRGIMEETDRAGLVRYTDSFATLRVFLLTG
jgi:hypothetical protein